MLAGVHNGFGPTEQPTENNDAISPGNTVLYFFLLIKY